MVGELNSKVGNRASFIVDIVRHHQEHDLHQRSPH